MYMMDHRTRTRVSHWPPGVRGSFICPTCVLGRSILPWHSMIRCQRNVYLGTQLRDVTESILTIDECGTERHSRALAGT